MESGRLGLAVDHTNSGWFVTWMFKNSISPWTVCTTRPWSWGDGWVLARLTQCQVLLPVALWHLGCVTFLPWTVSLLLGRRLTSFPKKTARF